MKSGEPKSLSKLRNMGENLDPPNRKQVEIGGNCNIPHNVMSWDVTKGCIHYCSFHSNMCPLYDLDPSGHCLIYLILE